MTQVFNALHVVAGLDRKDGGPSYSVPRLCSALRGAGCAASIITVGGLDKRATDDVSAHQGDWARLPILGSLRMSNALQRAAHEFASISDVIHVHGLWLMPNVYAGQAAAAAGRPLIVSPRGMLSPVALKFSKWKKRLFWVLAQGPAYRDAAVWHATSLEEARDIRAFGVAAPIVVIPNGVDLPESTAFHTRGAQRRTITYLSRIHPKKGLENLIAAWAEAEAQRPEWDLLIVGPDEGGHRRHLEGQAQALGAQRILFRSPIYGAEKENLLLKTDLFVLPTKNENFGVSVAEALAAGVPAIVTRGAPWAGLETERCGFWIEHGVEALYAAILGATALTAAERKAMGARGRTWMGRDFAWDAIGVRMLDVYKWVGGGGNEPPSLVSVS